MSSFYTRDNSEYQIGDIADTELYGNVTLIDKVSAESGNIYWIIEPHCNSELKLISENDLQCVGYYGD